MHLKNTFFALGLLAGSSLLADSWPAYRGPSGDGVSTEKLPTTTFPSDGPAAVWKTEVEHGFSSFTVAGNKALTLVTRDVDGNDMEVCIALDANTGKEIWAAPLWIANKWGGGGKSGEKGNDGGDGPRSTPVIDGDHAYVLDANLRLYALSMEDGEPAWQIDLNKKFGAKNIKWQNAASPLIDGDHLYVAAGGKGQSLICFNKKEGSVIWKAEDDAITHATPIIGEVQGVKQVIFFTQEGLVAVTPDAGDVLWRYEFPFKVSTAASPVIFEDIVYCSAGYGVGAGAVKVEKDGSGLKATEIWRTENDNINHWSTPVVKDGFLYGMFSFKEYGKGPLACVDIRTGKMKWKEAGFGPGNVILSADGELVILSDKGEIVLVDANPDSYKELARADVLSGKCWSTPSLTDGKIYARSTTEGGCFDLAKK
ncbi:PQQ-like beta-propeller repeat protein [Verrucomicrobiales bacterium]|nr:PQQ-like beta-propeller repeat protein [Verrucomicrobiales bacterium]MDB4662466.1 PQQ-like beta-propeller repeat protein [Verrucomicrobiales bacterium]